MCDMCYGWELGWDDLDSGSGGNFGVDDVKGQMLVLEGWVVL